MSSATTSEPHKTTGTFVVTLEKIEKATNGFLEFERRVPETIICESQEETEAYKTTSEPSVTVEIHDLDEVDENGVPLYLHDLFSRPEPDPEQYIRSRLNWINDRLEALGYENLETLMFLHPDGRLEPSKGKSQYPGTSKRFMYKHLSNKAKLDDEACQLGIVGETGVEALKATDPQSRLIKGMEFSAKFESLLSNYRHGGTFTFGKKVKSERRKAGRSTGAKHTALFNERIELVRYLLRRPGVSNTDPTVQLENVKREIVALENPILLKKDGSLLSDKTIKWWISNAQSLNTQEANRLSERRGKKLA